MEKLMTMKEVADLLRVSISTIFRWGERGILPSVSVPCRRQRVRRFVPSEIEAFMQTYHTPEGSGTARPE